MDLFSSLFIWWNKQTFSTRINTYFYGVLIGRDFLGNKYYMSTNKTRRWVIYGDENYASEISIEWHGWLHWTTNSIPFKFKDKGYEQSKVFPIKDRRFDSETEVSIKKEKAYEAWDPNS